MFWNITLTLAESSGWHGHDVFELVFCLAGEGSLLLDQQSIELRNRRTILIAPKVRHRFVFKADESADLKIVCMTTADMATYLSPAQGSILNSLKKLRCAFTDHPKKNSRLWRLVEMLPDGLSNEDHGERHVSWGIIGLLLASHARDQQLSGNGSKAKHFETIQKVCQWLDKHLDDTGNLDRIACRFGLSRSLLTREFRRHTSTSIVEYITIRRLQKAGTLLASSDKSITEAAFESGFPSITNFYRRFKGLYGVTPTEFRSQFFNNSMTNDSP